MFSIDIFISNQVEYWSSDRKIFTRTKFVSVILGVRFYERAFLGSHCHFLDDEYLAQHVTNCHANCARSRLWQKRLHCSSKTFNNGIIFAYNIHSVSIAKLKQNHYSYASVAVDVVVRKSAMRYF